VFVKCYLDDVAVQNWPHDCDLNYSVTLMGSSNSRLRVALEIHNLGTDQKMPLSMCFHPYFHIGDIATVSVTSPSKPISQLELFDQITNSASKASGHDSIVFKGVVDHVYADAGNEWVIHDPTLKRDIKIHKQGCSEMVVWNPGNTASSIADIGKGEEKLFVCVEPALVQLDLGKPSIEPYRLYVEPKAKHTCVCEVSWSKH